MKVCLQHVGSYFVAELVEAEDETHKTLVAEVRELTLSITMTHSNVFFGQVGGRAVGLISVSSELDLSLLQKCYQLEPFHGLCKQCEEDETVQASPEGEHYRVKTCTSCPCSLTCVPLLLPLQLSPSSIQHIGTWQCMHDLKKSFKKIDFTAFCNDYTSQSYPTCVYTW